MRDLLFTLAFAPTLTTLPCPCWRWFWPFLDRAACPFAFLRRPGWDRAGWRSVVDGLGLVGGIEFSGDFLAVLIKGDVVKLRHTILLRDLLKLF
jgi:hypothetical protein